MDTGDVAVSTMTLARDEQEEQWLRGAMPCLARAQMPVAVADGGSRKEFVDFLRDLPEFRVATARENGLVGQVKASLQMAYGLGTKFILYTEPDKWLFFDCGMSEFVARATNARDVGVVVASRSEA